MANKLTHYYQASICPERKVKLVKNYRAYFYNTSYILNFQHIMFKDQFIIQAKFYISALKQ